MTSPQSSNPPKRRLFRSILISISIHLVGAAVILPCLVVYNRFSIIGIEMNHEDCTAVNLYFLEALVFGIGIGVVGALFQVLDMRHWFGSVKRSTIIRLCLIWGSLLGFIGLSLVRFTGVDSGAWEFCLKNTVYSEPFGSISNLTYMLVVPVPILLLIGLYMTLNVWREERWWQTYLDKQKN